MTFTTTNIWWIMPFAVTLVCAFAATRFTVKLPKPSGGDYSSIGNAVLGFAIVAAWGVAVAVSLTAWLIWALVS